MEMILKEKLAWGRGLRVREAWTARRPKMVRELDAQGEMDEITVTVQEIMVDYRVELLKAGTPIPAAMEVSEAMYLQIPTEEDNPNWTPMEIL